MKRAFSEQVKKAMWERGWNIKDLARALRKHPGTVYSTLQTNNPHAETRKEYARVLGKELGYFV